MGLFRWISNGIRKDYIKSTYSIRQSSRNIQSSFARYRDIYNGASSAINSSAEGLDKASRDQKWTMLKASKQFQRNQYTAGVLIGFGTQVLAISAFNSFVDFWFDSLTFFGGLIMIMFMGAVVAMIGQPLYIMTCVREDKLLDPKTFLLALPRHILGIVVQSLVDCYEWIGVQIFRLCDRLPGFVMRLPSYSVRVFAWIIGMLISLLTFRSGLSKEVDETFKEHKDKK